MSAVRRWRERLDGALWRLRVRVLGQPPIRLSPVRPAPPVREISTRMAREVATGLPAFRVSGYPVEAVRTAPYLRQGLDYAADEPRLLELDDPAVPVDERHVALADSPAGLVEHPVTIAQYGLAAHGGWDQTGESRYLDVAVANGRALAALAEPEGGIPWFPYRFPHTYLDTTLAPPWYSAMAQGQALSLFVRLGQATGDPEWRELADRTAASLAVARRATGPWSAYVDEHDLIWFEEYVGDAPPLQVLNGHCYALFGLYDHVRATGDPVSRLLFDGGATTVLSAFPLFREPGEHSYYCARPGYGRRAEWQNVFYHPIHIQQLRWLGEMTGDGRFAEDAQALADDVRPVPPTERAA